MLFFGKREPILRNVFREIKENNVRRRNVRAVL